MAGLLFSSTPDRDGDHVDVERFDNYPDELVVSVFAGGNRVWNSAYVERGDVIALRDTLNDWLGETGGTATAPPAPPAYATEERVRQLIAEAILPLHKSPQAVGPDPDAEDGWRRSDPEPRDVGHPEPEVMCERVQPLNGFHAATRCTFCGFLWSDHPTFAEQLRRIGEAAAKVMAPVRQLVGCECGHRWSLHGGASCHGQIAGARTCECTRSAPQVQP